MPTFRVPASRVSQTQTALRCYDEEKFTHADKVITKPQSDSCCLLSVQLDLPLPLTQNAFYCLSGGESDEIAARAISQAIAIKWSAISEVSQLAKS